jgi:hypothetical protein
MADNYVKWVKQNVKQDGIASAPSTSSAADVLLADMERFIYGESFLIGIFDSMAVGLSAESSHLNPYIDGTMIAKASLSMNQAANTYYIIGRDVQSKNLFGLHKVEGRFHSSNTTTSSGKAREMTITEVE